MIKCSKCNIPTGWCNDFDAEDYGYEFEGVVGVYCCGECDTMYNVVSNFETGEEYVIIDD